MAGLYRVTGEDPALREALQALGYGTQGVAGSQLTITSGTGGALDVALRGNDAGHPLEFSTQYSCTDGWMVFKAPLPARRGGYAGMSTVRLKRGADALEVEVTFTGRRWLTLFSYESAYVGVPLPFTGTTITRALQWPVDQVPERLADPARPPPERTELVAARKLLDESLLPGVALTGMEPRGDGVLVHLRAPQADDVRQFEQRLRAASIDYEIARAPVWSDRWYSFDIVVWPQRGRAHANGRARR